MIKYYFLLLTLLACTSSDKKKESDISILGTFVEVDTSGSTKVVTRYSDSTISVVNLNKEGVLIDSVSHKVVYKP